MKLKRNQLIGLLVAVGVLFVGGLVYLVLLMSEAGDSWPFYNEQGTHVNDINKLNKSIADLRKKIRDIEEVRVRLEETKSEHRLARHVLPPENNPDELLASIRQKAIQSGALPRKIESQVKTGALGVVNSSGKASGGRGRGKGQGTKASGAFDEWIFTLDLLGSYDQIATFINTMEEFETNNADAVGSERRFFHVSQINLNASKDTMAFQYTQPELPENSLHTCTLVMSTFRYTGNDE